MEERYPLAPLLKWAKEKTVPAGRSSLWYYFGGLALFLFSLQLITGILLMLYYRAGVDTAFESVHFITTKVPFGWLVRSVHAWAGDLLILTAILHMFSAFFMRAYEKPRELTWFTGVFLLLILLAFGFSGYLLPWNELSFFATKVGTDILRVIPFLGDTLVELLRGGEEVAGATLQRFYAVHVIVLPLLLLGIMGIHLLFVQIQGMHEPKDWENQPEKKKTIPFFPHFVLRDVFLWCIVLNLLAILAFLYPAHLGIKADAFTPPPAGIRPEWYFLWAYQVLKMLPAHMGFVDGETLGVFGMSLGFLLWLLVPWIDSEKHPKWSRWIQVLGILLLVFLITMTILGYILP